MLRDLRAGHRECLLIAQFKELLPGLDDARLPGSFLCALIPTSAFSLVTKALGTLSLPLLRSTTASPDKSLTGLASRTPEFEPFSVGLASRSVESLASATTPRLDDCRPGPSRTKCSPSRSGYPMVAPRSSRCRPSQRRSDRTSRFCRLSRHASLGRFRCRPILHWGGPR